MTFSRDDMAAYEKQTPAPVEPVPEPVAVAPVTPPAEVVPVSAEAPLASAETPQDAPVSDDSSLAVVADPAPASAETDSETPSDIDAAPRDEKPRRNEARERIEELVAERNALRKYGEHLLRTVDELKKPVQPVTPAPEIDTDPPPTLEQHQFDPSAFSKAQNEWVQRQVDKRVATAVQGLEARRDEATLRSNFESKTAEFKKLHTDYDLVISNPALPPLAPNTARLIIKSEQGPDLAYHLAKNPDLATRIARMDTEQQAMAIGRLEAQLTATPVTKPNLQKRTVTQAPPPPKPVSSGASIVTKTIAEMSMDEFVAHERSLKLAQKEARQRLRRAMGR